MRSTWFMEHLKEDRDQLSDKSEINKLTGTCYVGQLVRNLKHSREDPVVKIKFEENRDD